MINKYCGITIVDIRYFELPLEQRKCSRLGMFKIAKNQTKKSNKKKCILHTQKYINLTCNTLRGKIETKGTLLGEKSKIA